MSLYDTAFLYREAGLSVAGSRSKGANIIWHELQQRLPTDEELAVSFISKQATWIAIICGAGSGNLEVIDFDLQYDETGTVWEQVWAEIVDYYKGQPPFALVKSRSGGMHLYYRCDQIEGNLDLAYRLFEGKKKAVIQTRGQGGLIMAPPSPGYTDMEGRIPHGIPTITPEEREDIWTICRSYNTVFDDQPADQADPNRFRKSNHQFKQTPWHAYNASDAFQDILREDGWTFVQTRGERDLWRRPGKDEGISASFHRTGRWFWAFSSNQDHYLTNRYYTPYDIYVMRRHDGNKPKAVRALLEAGFGRKYNTSEEALIQRAIEQFNTGDLATDIRNMLQADFDQMVVAGEAEAGDLDDIIDTAQGRAEAAKGLWWNEHPKTGKLSIDAEPFRDFLYSNGYRLFVNEPEAEAYRIIRIDPARHWVYHVHLDVFKKEIIEWIDTQEFDPVTRRKVVNMVMLTTDSRFKQLIDYLPRINLNEIRFLKKAGDRKTQYLTFKNLCVKVTDKDYQLIPYDQLDSDMMVWRRDIKPYNFTLLDIELESELNQCPVWIFLKRICGIGPDIEHLDHEEELPHYDRSLYDKFMAMLTTIGYLLSAYKDPSEPFSPIFEENTQSAEEGGGTGKGLIFAIIGQVRNVIDIDLKTVDFNKDFVFSRVNLDTDVVHLEDAEKSFKMSKLNNVISSGMTINRKYEHEFKIDYELSPKVAVSSNYTIDADFEFEKRRQKKLFLERYFGRNYKPEDDPSIGVLFKEKHGWTPEKQNLTYNILLYILHKYLRRGVVDAAPTVNAAKRYLEERYKQPFVTFCEEVITAPERIGKWQDLKELRDEFLRTSGEQEKWWSMPRWGVAVKSYAERMGWKYAAARISVSDKDKASCCVILNPVEEVPPAVKPMMFGYLF